MKIFIILTLLVALCNGAEKTITNKNWREILEGEWMIKFYAPWCPACRAMTTTWKEFAVWASRNTDGVSVGSVDVTAQAELNGRFMVTSLPTIYHVKDGEFRQYKSSRTLKDFKDFITEKQWEPIKPMSAWLKPDSFAMSSVSKLFSFSMNLKTFHESLRSDYGLPGWASMLMFGLAVVIIGLLLGIGLVLLIDWFMGPQNDYSEQQQQQDEGEDKDDTTKQQEVESESKKEESDDDEEEKDEQEEKKVRKRRTVKAD